MWTAARIWIAAGLLGIGAMLLLLFVVGLFLDPAVPTEDVTVATEEVATESDATSCTFRVSGSVADSNGTPIASAVIEFREAGPFATPDRIATTNYTGQFLYTESGFGTCYLENLFPTVRSEGYLPWSRDTAISNDEELDVMLSSRSLP